MTSLQTTIPAPVHTLSSPATAPGGGAVGKADDVIAAARRGDQAAWEQIYRHFGPLLARYAASRGVDDAEDLTQDVMYVAAQRLHSFSGTWENLQSWLFTIAYRRCADHHRRRYRSREDPAGRLLDEPDPRAGADASLWADGESREALAALGILNERERDVITLRVIGELGTRDVAAALGVSRSNVRVIQSRALGKLRSHLENNGGHLDKRFRSVFGLLAITQHKMNGLTRLADMREALPSDGRLGAWAETLRRAPLPPPSNLTATAMAAAEVATRTAGMATIAPGAASGLGNALAVAAIAAVGAGAVVGMPTPSSHSPAPPTPAVDFPAGNVTAFPAKAVEDAAPVGDVETEHGRIAIADRTLLHRIGLESTDSPTAVPVATSDGMFEVVAPVDVPRISEVLDESVTSEVTDLIGGVADSSPISDELASVGSGTSLHGEGRGTSIATLAVQDATDEMTSSPGPGPAGEEQTATEKVTDTATDLGAGALDSVTGD